MHLSRPVCPICGSYSSYTSFLYVIFLNEGNGLAITYIFPLSYVYYRGRVGFVRFNFVGDFVSYCLPSCYVMLSANKLIYANKTIDIMMVIEMFSLKFIRLLRVVFSSQQRLNRRAVNAVQ